MISVIFELKKEVKELQMQLQGTKAGEHRTGKEQGCYQCGNITHFKRDCPMLGRSRQQEAQPAAGAIPKRQGEDQPHCEGCDRKGHWLSECWRTPTAAGGAGRRRTVQNAQSMSRVWTTGALDDRMLAYFGSLEKSGAVAADRWK